MLLEGSARVLEDVELGGVALSKGEFVYIRELPNATGMCLVLATGPDRMILQAPVEHFTLLAHNSDDVAKADSEETARPARRRRHQQGFVSAASLVRIEVGSGGSADTFTWRQDLRSNGFKWDADRGIWSKVAPGDDDKLVDRYKKAGLNVTISPAALRK